MMVSATSKKKYFIREFTIDGIGQKDDCLAAAWFQSQIIDIKDRLTFPWNLFQESGLLF